MENFVVSARKYRPATFDTVVGQAHITTTLKNAIRSNHLAQAFLFCGPRGVGKTTCARILAKTINCTNRTPDAEACNVCESCVSFNQNGSFNVHELDAASNNSVDDIRHLVDQVRYPPQVGNYKVYIIDEVHMLSNAAFNAFLKTLEEPPSYAIFILATTEKFKIIPTILSRCQIFDFNRIQPPDISAHLRHIADQEGVEAEEEALQLIAQKADGGLRDALSLFDLLVTFSANRRITYAQTIDNLHILDYDYYFRLTDSLLAQNLGQCLLTFDQILRQGFDGHNFVVGLLEHFRNLLVCKDADTVQLLEVAPSIQRKYLEQATRASTSFLLSALSVGSHCDLHYKASKAQRLLVELMLMKMAHLTAALSPQSLLTTQPPAIVAAPPSYSADQVPAPPAAVTPPAARVPVAGPAPAPVTAPATVATASAAEEAPAETAPAPVVPVLSYKVGGKLKSTVRLDGLDAPDAPTAVAEPSAPAVAMANEPFDAAQLQTHWDAFVRTREAQNRSSEAIVLNRPLTLRGTIIHLQLDSALQTDLLAGVRTELLTYLRQQLRNQAISLESELAPPESKKMLYTAQDKFQHLAEKNPALHELRATFGLEYDY